MIGHRLRGRTEPRDQLSDSCAAHSSYPVNPSQVPHHGRSSFAPWARGYFAAFNRRSRGQNLLHDGPLRDGLGAAYQVPRQASGLFTSEGAATAPRADFGAPETTSPQQASGLFSAECSAAAHDDGRGRETSRPIQCAAHSSRPVMPSQVPRHGRLSVEPGALGHFAAVNMRSRGRDWLHEGPLRDGLGDAYQVPRQASGIFSSDGAATTPRPDFGAPGSPSTAQPQGCLSPRALLTA